MSVRPVPKGGHIFGYFLQADKTEDAENKDYTE
jgi:hypothetical protein